MFSQRRSQYGISLVEALVALAVMAFGTLGTLGIQTTLRMNSDISRQRGEAVRIAQETIEAARAFQDVAAWRDDIADAGPLAVTGLDASNTTYTVQTVVAEDASENAARLKTATVTVRWTDRTGAEQQVQMQSSIQGVPPGLSGSLALPRDTGPVRSPRGRHFSIPRETVLQADGKLAFSPPGLPGVRWIFNHLTGDITQICLAADACIETDRRLLSGYVRFATLANPPQPQDAELPPGSLLPAGVSVYDGTTPEANLLTDCAVRDDVSGRAYHCAVPVSTGGKWSGMARVTGIGTLATNLIDSAGTKVRVCRYTPVRGCQPAVGSLIWGLPQSAAACSEPMPQTSPPTPSRLMTNGASPLNYLNVTSAKVNQNFLVILAGNGTQAYNCPDDVADDPGTPSDDNSLSALVNTNTWHHQPSQ